MNRKRVIFVALLGGLMLSLLYAYLTMPRLEKAPPKSVRQRVPSTLKGTRTLPATAAQGRINFDFLTVEPLEFTGVERDIFHFKTHRPTRTSPPVAVVAPVTPVVTLPAEALIPFGVVQKALGKFTFLGFLEKAGEKTVFLSSGGKLFLAKRGENFGADQEFQVANIEGNLLQVRHAGRDGLVEIPLIEKQKLSASVSSPATMQPLAGGGSQPQARTLPNRRVLRPPTIQETEEPYQEVIEENDPKEGQGTEPYADGNVLEGETNGSKQ
jgi:hypothetical protein